MNIVITGGHLSPAFSVIEKLKDDNVLFIGRKHALTDDDALSLEYQLCQKYGIAFEEVKSAKLYRNSFGKTIFTLSILSGSVISAISILKKFKPDVVVGFGGYVSLPVIFASKVLKIPVVIHEQTLEAGIANKIAANFANKICISWQSSEKFFPKSKIILTGIPIRQDLLSPKRKTASLADFKNKELPVIYTTGGSLGSHLINSLVEETLVSLLKLANIIHQTGDSRQYMDFERLSKIAEDGYYVRKLFTSDELSSIYQTADLVVSRSGANTLTELIYFRKPAFLIPLQFGQKNEQLKNGLFYKQLGLGEVVKQSDLNPMVFLATIKQMLLNISQYAKDSEKNIIKRNAAEEIIKVIRHVAQS